MCFGVIMNDNQKYNQAQFLQIMSFFEQRWKEFVYSNTTNDLNGMWMLANAAIVYLQDTKDLIG